MSDVYIAVSRMEDDVLSTVDFLDAILVIAEAGCSLMSLLDEGRAAGLMRVVIEALSHANSVKVAWLKLFEMTKLHQAD